MHNSPAGIEHGYSRRVTLMSCYDPVTACGNDMKIIQADEPQGNDYEVNVVHKYVSWGRLEYLLLTSGVDKRQVAKLLSFPEPEP